MALLERRNKVGYVFGQWIVSSSFFHTETEGLVPVLTQ